MSKKNYNIWALQGQDVDDLTVRDQMKEAGIDIPIDLVNTPEMNNFIINETYKQNLRDLQNLENPETGELYTPAEAKMEADREKSQALANVRRWMKAD